MFSNELRSYVPGIHLALCFLLLASIVILLNTNSHSEVSSEFQEVSGHSPFSIRKSGIFLEICRSRRDRHLAGMA